MTHASKTAKIIKNVILSIITWPLGFTKLMTQHQLNFLLTPTTTCLSVYCQTVTTFSATYCLTRLIMNTIFETAVTIAHCVLKEMRKTF